MVGLEKLEECDTEGEVATAQVHLAFTRTARLLKQKVEEAVSSGDVTKLCETYQKWIRVQRTMASAMEAFLEQEA